MQDSTTHAEVSAGFLNRKQAAQFLNISEAWIRKQERLGRGPARVRLGKCVRYSREALAAFARAHTDSA
jgi:predicted DNA-binding transcriptional regulator AlpA